MPLLSGGRKSSVHHQIVASAKAIPNNEAKAIALADAAKFCSSSDDARVLMREAIDIARTLSEDDQRISLLIDIASRLPDAPESQAALQQAYDSRMMLAQSAQGCHILCRLAAQLPAHRDELIARAFEAATAISDINGRAQAFANLVGDLSGVQRLTALRCILEHCSRIPRGNALDILGALAPVLAQEGGDELILSAIDAIQRIAKWWP